MNTEIVRSKQGFSLAAAFLYVATITVVFASVTSLVLTEYRITKDSTARTQALYAAEAGINLALHAFNKKAQETAWNGWTQDGTTYHLDSAPPILAQESTLKPELSVTAEPTSLTITATGRAFSAARSTTISRCSVVTLKREHKTHVIQSWDEL